MNTQSNQPSEAKVLVIGLDGATFDLINPWVEEGLLPTFKKIIEKGSYGPLTTIIPPLTGPAWTSFMTGKNPGKHSLYDFVIPASKSYTGVPINASRRHGESIWSILSRANKKTGVFSVPVTYPPEEVNGFMVTGMLTPTDATDFTYPLELGQDLKTKIPNFDLAPESAGHVLGREMGLLEGLDQLSTVMMDSTRYLMEKFDWDFYMVVFKEPDLAMHWLWRFMDPEHPWYVSDAEEELRDGLLTVYQRMDDCLSELYEIVGEDTTIILMSDHGAGPLDTYFHVNTWLVDQGFMELKGDVITLGKRLLYKFGFTPIGLYKTIVALRQGKQVARTMRERKKTAISLLRKVFLSFESVNWSATRAYSLGNYGQIYINLKGREPEGIVSPGKEYEEVIQDLITKLESLTNPVTKKPIKGKAYRKEEIYQGDQFDKAPDLVYMPDDLRINGFGLYQFSSHKWLEPTFDRSGGHRMDGIFTITGPGIRQNNKICEARIIDLAPTILATMGVPIPDDMDGKVIDEAFGPAYFEDQPIKYVEAQSTITQEPLEFTEEEEEEIKQRLRDLGYMA